MDAAARRVSIAVGMITAPFLWDRRGQVRSTMLQYPPLRHRRMAFRFVIGNYLPSLSDSDSVRSKVAALSANQCGLLQRRRDARKAKSVTLIMLG